MCNIIKALSFLVFSLNSLLVQGYLPLMLKTSLGTGSSRNQILRLSKPIDATPPRESVEADKNMNFQDTIIGLIFKALPEAMGPLTSEVDESKMISCPPKFTKPRTISEIRKDHQHAGNKLWDSQDIIATFESKYKPLTKVASASPRANIVKSNDPRKLVQILDDLDEIDLLDSLEEYIGINLYTDVDYPENVSDVFCANDFVSNTADKLAHKNINMALDGDTKKDSESSEPSLVDRLKGTELYVVDGVAQAFQPLNDKINPAKLVHDAKPFKQSVTLSQLRKILKNKPDYFK